MFFYVFIKNFCLLRSMKSIKDIDITNLPKKRRLVIQYALTHPDKVVLMRMEELGDKLGVNPATVVKACKAIGLNGFL